MAHITLRRRHARRCMMPDNRLILTLSTLLVTMLIMPMLITPTDFPPPRSRLFHRRWLRLRAYVAAHAYAVMFTFDYDPIVARARKRAARGVR